MNRGTREVLEVAVSFIEARHRMLKLAIWQWKWWWPYNGCHKQITLIRFPSVPCLLWVITWTSSGLPWNTNLFTKLLCYSLLFPDYWSVVLLHSILYQISRHYNSSLLWDYNYIIYMYKLKLLIHETLSCFILILPAILQQLFWFCIYKTESFITDLNLNGL